MCRQLATLVIYANKTIVNLALKRLLNDRLLARASVSGPDTHTHINTQVSQTLTHLSIARISCATRLRFVAAA